MCFGLKLKLYNIQKAVQWRYFEYGFVLRPCIALNVFLKLKEGLMMNFSFFELAFTVNSHIITESLNSIQNLQHSTRQQQTTEWWAGCSEYVQCDLWARLVPGNRPEQDQDSHRNRGGICQHLLHTTRLTVVPQGRIAIGSVADPHLLICGSGSRIQKMSIWILIRILGVKTKEEKLHQKNFN